MAHMTFGKPQGFCEGKLARQGLFACYYGCGQFFRSRTEAKNHFNCPGSEKCDKDIKKMRRLSGFQDNHIDNRSGKIFRLYDSSETNDGRGYGCTMSASSASADPNSPNNTERGTFWQNIPTIDKNTIVRKFLESM